MLRLIISRMLCLFYLLYLYSVVNYIFHLSKNRNNTREYEPDSASLISSSIVLAVGLVSTVLIMRCLWTPTRNVWNIFAMVMCICDFGVVSFNFIYDVFSVYPTSFAWVYVFVSMFLYFFSSLSGYVKIYLCYDRCKAMWRPVKPTIYQSDRKARIVLVVFSVVTFLLSLSLHVSVFLKKIPTTDFEITKLAIYILIPFFQF